MTLFVKVLSVSGVSAYLRVELRVEYLLNAATSARDLKCVSAYLRVEALVNARDPHKHASDPPWPPLSGIARFLLCVSILTLYQ